MGFGVLVGTAALTAVRAVTKSVRPNVIPVAFAFLVAVAIFRFLPFEQRTTN
jgi:hypothetical protein